MRGYFLAWLHFSLQRYEAALSFSQHPTDFPGGAGGRTGVVLVVLLVVLIYLNVVAIIDEANMQYRSGGL